MLSSSAYDGYGNESNSGGTPTDPFGFNAASGYYLDRETGLYYCQNLYYDPGAGRWINRDPIEYAGGINLYGYCGDGPVGRVDPLGLIDSVSATCLRNPVFCIEMIKDGTIGLAALSPAAQQFITQYASQHSIELEEGTEEISNAAQYADKLSQAVECYANKADKSEWHHLTPKYLGGDPNGPMVHINAAYHQMITNAFRNEHGYGQSIPPEERLLEILKAVYDKFPIPAGTPIR